MKLFFGFSLIAILLLFAYFLLDENIENHYSNYEQASQNGIVPSDTWLPAFLPKTAIEIKERYNIDTNETWVFFKYSESDKLDLAKLCESLPFDKVIFPRVDRTSIVSWWDNLEESKFDFFSCEQNSFLAINKNFHEAYFWRLAQ